MYTSKIFLVILRQQSSMFTKQVYDHENFSPDRLHRREPKTVKMTESGNQLTSALYNHTLGPCMKVLYKRNLG